MLMIVGIMVLIMLIMVIFLNFSWWISNVVFVVLSGFSRSINLIIWIIFVNFGCLNRLVRNGVVR